MDLPRPGWAEVDADAVWWREVCAISTRADREAARQTPRWPACASAASGPCLVLCDDDLRPLRPAILYGIDTRAHAEIAALTEELGEDAILDRAGTLLSSQAVGPKIEWVRHHEPEIFAAAAGWYGSNSYIAAKLTGEYVMDHHTASQCDPLYATREFGWNTRVGRAHLRPAAAARGWSGPATSSAGDRCGSAGDRPAGGHCRSPPAPSTPTRRPSRWGCGARAIRC